MSRIFSEKTRSGSSKGEGHSRGTPTMYIKIYDVEGGVGGGSGVSVTAIGCDLFDGVLIYFYIYSPLTSILFAL